MQKATSNVRSNVHWSFKYKFIHNLPFLISFNILIDTLNHQFLTNHVSI